MSHEVVSINYSEFIRFKLRQKWLKAEDSLFGYLTSRYMRQIDLDLFFQMQFVRFFLRGGLKSCADMSIRLTVFDESSSTYPQDSRIETSNGRSVPFSVLPGGRVLEKTLFKNDFVLALLGKEALVKHIKFGKFLKLAREKKGLSQNEVAKLLGYSTAQFISNLERGISPPPLKVLKLIKEIYELDSQELMSVIQEEQEDNLKKNLAKLQKALK
jgi:hypothetical protein